MNNFLKIRQHKYLLIGSVSLFLLTLLQSCQKNTVQTLPNRNYQLVWSDNFDSLKLDASKWSFDIGSGGWGNSELETYTNSSANLSMDGNGHLMIKALQPSSGVYTSARIKSKNLFSQTYGRIEASIKTPYGPGIWPAFWMLGSNIDTVGWPQCGEIDIMEQQGQAPNINHGSVHGPGYSGASAITKAYQLPNGRFDTDYHLYAIEWGPDYIDFFVDNFLYEVITPGDVTGNWVFNHPFYILLNVAVGGTYVGWPTSSTPFPQTMYVDYVKVYNQL